MEVKSYNVFRIRAYQNVIISIEALTLSVYSLWENKRLSVIPGMGSTISSHLEELFTSGKVVEYEAIKRDLPEGMFELIGLRGIGAKKAFRLAEAFQLTSREDSLEKIKSAAKNGQIRNLEGFGEKSEKLILEAISEYKMIKNEKPRMLIVKAEQVSDRLSSYLRLHPQVLEVEALGSLRRRQATIGDLDIAIVTTDSEAVLKYFLKYPEITEVLVQGDQRVAVILSDDIQVDIRVCEKKNFGSMVQYFTGSKNHNIVLRTYALGRGYSLSEYGIKKSGKLHEFSNELDFYEFLHLDYIPPEIRHGSAEVELASTHKLPKLVDLKDIRGDLHTHTIASDGLNTMGEMLKAASEKGYEYYGITDHAPSVQSRGYDEVAKIIENTKNKITKFNKNSEKLKVFFGYEVNILADASLGVPDDLLKLMDYAIAAIHTSFMQDQETMTKRLIAAVENPYIHIIGHPCGRLINEREAADIDWREFFIAVKQNDKIIEINAQPNRLDLPEDLVVEAVDRGIELVINTDAHSVSQLENMKYGVDVARRAMCDKKHILNTKSLGEIEKAFK